MDERLRTQYLQHLGVDVYVPRWVLPAAKASAQALLPEPDNVDGEDSGCYSHTFEEQLVSSNDTAPDLARRDTSVAASTLTGGLLDELRPAERSKPSSAAANEFKSTAVDHQVRFALSIWRIDQLIILDSRLVNEPLPTQALLKNILFCKGIEQLPRKPEILHWPMFNEAGSGGWQAASEMVNAFLRARLEQQPITYLWLMGRSAYGAVLGDESNYSDQLGSVCALNHLNALGVVLPSLANMLKDPSLKAIAWRAIRDLD